MDAQSELGASKVAQLLTGGISGLESLDDGQLRHIGADGCGWHPFQPQARASIAQGYGRVPK